ncbi:hypothetical protein ACHAWF_010251 [Thalassiosira exigua]
MEVELLSPPQLFSLMSQTTSRCTTWASYYDQSASAVQKDVQNFCICTYQRPLLITTRCCWRQWETAFRSTEYRQA